MTSIEDPDTRPPFVPSHYARKPFSKETWLVWSLPIYGIVVSLLGHKVLTDASTEHFDALRSSTPHLREPFPLFKWLGSIGYDNSDTQWRDFSGNLPLLGPVLVAYVLVARALRHLFPLKNNRSPLTPACAQNALTEAQRREIASFDKDPNRPRVKLNLLGHPTEEETAAVHASLTPLAWYYCIGGLFFSFYLHGYRFLFMLALLLVNYAFAKYGAGALPKPLFMALFWVFHVVVLFVNSAYDGYRFGSISSSLAWMDPGSSWELVRWNIVFNMSTLRMIAFNTDYEEALSKGPETMEKVEYRHRTTCDECLSRRTSPCLKVRTATPRPLSDYSLVHYLAYIFYIPLYIAGPMGGFNNFVSHIYIPQRFFGLRYYARYFSRILVLTAVLLYMLHFEFLNAIRGHSSVFSQLSLGTKCFMMYLTLGFLWLKFSIIWKVFRLMALLDGVEVPEDMARCYCQTTNVANFWRDWHASFNIWIIRYMYIPLGGSRYRLLAIFPIFFFIAIWHDIEMELFWWALTICIGFVPEIIITLYFSKKKFNFLRQKPYYPLLRSLSSLGAISMLVVANLFGYGTGTGKTTETNQEVGWNWHTMCTVLTSLGIFFSSAHLEWRRRDMSYEETRRLRWELGIVEKDIKTIE